MKTKHSGKMKNSLTKLFIMLCLVNSVFLKIYAEPNTYVDTLLIDEIDVQAKQSAGALALSTGSVSLLTQDAILLKDQLSIAQQLNSLPGVYMQQGTFNTNRIVIRGIGSRTPYSTNRVRVYLNDIPITNGDGVSSIEDIQTNGLGTIEIMKGPNSALYGSGLGGIIKLRTISMNSGMNAFIRTGSYNTQQYKLSGAGNLGNMKINTSLHHTHSDGYRENNQYKSYTGLVSTAWNLANSNVLFTIYGTSVRAQIPSSIDQETFINSPYKAASNWLAAKGNEQNDKLVAGITINHSFSNTTSTYTTLFSGISNAFEHRPFNDLSENSSNYGVRSRIQYHRSNFNAIGGLELFTETYDWSTSKVEGEKVNYLNQVAENRRYANLFSYFSYRSNKLLLSGAINLNALAYVYARNEGTHDEYSYPIILSPRLGFNYEVSANLHYYGSMGHGFSHPSLEETLMPNGIKNPSLKPESGWMTELGARAGNSNNWYFDACLYAIKLDNLLVTKRISEEDFMGINAGKTFHFGAEFNANAQVLGKANETGNLALTGSFTLGRNRFLNFIDGENDYSGNVLPGIPSNVINLQLKWQVFKTTSLLLNNFNAGKQFLNDSNNEFYSGYNITNVAAYYSFSFNNKASVSIQGGMNNIFNANYASMILVNAPSFGNTNPRYYYPGLARNAYLSLTIIL